VIGDDCGGGLFGVELFACVQGEVDAIAHKEDLLCLMI
jgi:hypothetical protein